jgi:hypothetical protein
MVSRLLVKLHLHVQDRMEDPGLGLLSRRPHKGVSHEMSQPITSIAFEGRKNHGCLCHRRQNPIGKRLCPEKMFWVLVKVGVPRGEIGAENPNTFQPFFCEHVFFFTHQKGCWSSSCCSQSSQATKSFLSWYWSLMARELPGISICFRKQGSQLTEKGGQVGDSKSSEKM